MFFILASNLLVAEVGTCALGKAWIVSPYLTTLIKGGILLKSSKYARNEKGLFHQNYP